MTESSDPSADLDRLAQAFVERARRGEFPSIESYAADHPEMADDIRELFPVLAMVEGLKADASTTGAPSGLHRAPLLPSRVGAYRIGEEIGRGGMGSVHEGHRVDDVDLPERVAVKVVHRDLLEKPEFVARFLREAAAGSRVVHDHVVRTLDTGIVDVDGEEVPFILLEYIAGQNLRALLREVEVVPERLCRHVGRCLADALAAVHAVGLVHRDVKPENVVITTDETVKLMDLGVAVLQDRMQRLSRTGEFVGSLLYAAPGQVAGDAPDPGWDLHALGILLYELATGRHPARGASLRWLRATETARGAWSHRDGLAHLSPFFATVVETLLAPDEAASFESAAALRTVLDEGERSAWWRSRRERAATPASRLKRLERPTRFHGRKAEWKVLDAALARASEGHGQVVLLEGEAGIGKTRLLHEWMVAQRSTQISPHVLLVPHFPGAKASDESHLAAALAEQLGGGDLEEHLRRLLGSRARLAPGLARRLRGEAPGHDESSFDAAYLSVLRALADQRPLLLVYEDLHFASARDLDRFLFLARGLASNRLMLVGTLRPMPTAEDLHELGLLGNATHVTLGGLDTDACRALLLEASQAAPRLGESIASLAERSDRNPLFLLELVRDTMREPDPEGGNTTSVPASVRGLLAARVAALAPEDRELLEAAACQGFEFDPVVVADAAGLGRVRALKRFGRMERTHGLLRAAGRQYRFQHHLVQEVLYGQLHTALRERYHAALGEALEAESTPDDGEAAYALCAQHLQGDQPARAGPYVRRAMEYLEWELDAYVRSEELAERALAVPSLLEGVDRAFALQIRGRSRLSSGHPEEALPPLEEALGLVRAAEAHDLAFHVLKTLAWRERVLGNPEKTQAYLVDAVEAAHAAEDPGREAVALARMGVNALNQGRVDEASALVRKAFDALGDFDDPFARARLTNDLATVHFHQGNLEEAHATLTRAAELSHEIGDVPTEFLIASQRGRLAFRRGRFAEAQEHGRAALDLGRQLGMHHRDAFLLVNVARCLRRVGRYDEAMTTVTEAMGVGGGERDTPVTARLERGALHAARGDLGAALEDLLAANDEAREAKRRDVFLSAGIELAEALGLLGRREEAASQLDRIDAALAEGAPLSAGVRTAAARGLLMEFEGRVEPALAGYERAATLAAERALLTGPFSLPRGRLLLRSGRGDEAEPLLRASVAWAKESGASAHAVLALGHLARHDPGEVLAARVALEQHDASLTAAERIEAHFALWEASGEHDALAAAWRELRRLRGSAPPADRERMIERVDLLRRVAAAWATQGR